MLVIRRSTKPLPLKTAGAWTWQDEEAHLLPDRHRSAWIQTNLYLNFAEAPFDREDTAIKVEAGVCTTYPRRSGYNTGLFADVQRDHCLTSFATN